MAFNRRFFLRGGVVIVGIFIFFAYSFLPLSQYADLSSRGVSLKFDTPDETVAYAIATAFAEHSRLWYEEPLNTSFKEPLIFQRWMRPVGDRLYPGTFLGFLLAAGILAKGVGVWVVPFLTPLAAVVLLGCVTFLLRGVFPFQTALFSTVLLGISPVFVYYASRTMFHAIFFLCLLFLGSCFLVLVSKKQNFLLTGVAGLLFGFSLVVRFADIFLVCSTILLCILLLRVPFKKILVLFFGVVCGALPVFFLNTFLYGSPFDFGYLLPSGGSAFLPFGLHLGTVRFVFLAVAESFWPYLLGAFIGWCVFAAHFWEKSRRGVVLVTLFCCAVSIELFLLYGSRFFSDSLGTDPEKILIGSSYFRYLLPFFVIISIFCSLAVTHALSFFSSRLLKSGVGAAFLLAALFHTYAVAYVGEEGLLHVRRQVLSYRAVVRSLHIAGARESDVFLVRRGEDKILFPDFPRVINRDVINSDRLKRELSGVNETLWFSQNGFFKKMTPKDLEKL